MTGLSNQGYLEVDITDSSGTERTCVFGLREDLETSTGTIHLFLLGNRGQYIREAYQIGTDVLGIEGVPEPDNRRGYHVDGGAGAVTITLSATAGDRDAQWGDGSSAANDPDDVTKYDATGCGPQAQQDIIDYVVGEAKTDSANAARLYVGQWSDGTHADTAGAFGKPRAVAIAELMTTNPPDDPSAFSVTIEAIWTALFPESVLDEAQDALDELIEAIPE
jgi:hypothetical protein